jgi:hypothetical protein
MAIVCAAVAQLQTLLMIWRDRHEVLPLVLPGIFGVPVGTLLLRIQSRDRRLSRPLSGYALFRRGGAWGGRTADGVVGFAAGFWTD